jgi:cyclic pyranopterin phosphate synthase
MTKIALKMMTDTQLTESAPLSRVDHLVDSFGRAHTSLRLSLTDRCNLRCGYCMEEEASFVPSSALLNVQELVGLASLFVELGIRRIRLTGGEPLLRRDLPELVGKLKSIEGLQELTLTTNGILLADMAKELRFAGLDRLTISLDTLDPLVFERITRRRGLEKVLAGVDAACSAGFQGTGINTVLLRGINDTEAGALIRYAHGRGIRPRFIETMPIGAGEYERDRFVPADDLLGLIRNEFGSIEHVAGNSPSSPAKLFRVETGLIGIIASVSEPFCGHCDRLRLTADGKMRSCLFALEETDLLPLIRGVGVSKARSSLIQAISGNVWAKRSGHGMHEDGFTKPSRTMHSIGG